MCACLSMGVVCCLNLKAVFVSGIYEILKSSWLMKSSPLVLLWQIYQPVIMLPKAYHTCFSLMLFFKTVWWWHNLSTCFKCYKHFSESLFTKESNISGFWNDPRCFYGCCNMVHKFNSGTFSNLYSFEDVRVRYANVFLRYPYLYLIPRSCFRGSSLLNGCNIDWI